MRDIRPWGLNVANGASETKEEYKDLDQLIQREFREESLVLQETPDGFRARRLVLCRNGSPVATEQDAEAESQAVARDLERHCELRRADGVQIVLPDADDRLDVDLLEGSDTVCVLSPLSSSCQG